MEATLQLPGLEPTEGPFRGDCPSCGTEVLAIDVSGHELVVEVAEVLETFACPNCAQVAARGHRRSGCTRCGETGVIGEELPFRGVAVDSIGGARVVRSGDRREGEAVHVFHSCAVV